VLETKLARQIAGITGTVSLHAEMHRYLGRVRDLGVKLYSEKAKAFNIWQQKNRKDDYYRLR
jgi:hypothetical protein